MTDLPEYPRTLHLGDSGGGSSRHRAPFSELDSCRLVVEEKVDGSHSGLFFDDEAELRLFSRGTVLEAGTLGADFRPLWELARRHLDELWDVLEQRYVLYGEWTLLLHSIYYDNLPSFFLEDDIYDREAERFLSTARRRALTERLPDGFDHSVAVLAGPGVLEPESLPLLVDHSRYKSAGWRENCPALELCEDSDSMEGLYIKHESENHVLGRYKWVRPEFLKHIQNAQDHWRSRAAIQNRLREP